MDLREFNEVAAMVGSEFLATGLEPNQFFQWAILKQNTMYELPVSAFPGFSALNELVSKRLKGFMGTLQKEINEGQEIMAYVKVWESFAGGESDGTAEIGTREAMVKTMSELGTGFDHETMVKLVGKFHEFSETALAEDEDMTYGESLEAFIMVSMADWHADLAIYNRSEALKYGIPLETVQNIVMNSNFTKLGADGLPIKNEEGKFEKGPNYVAPEAHIYALMYESEKLAEEASEVIEQAAIAEGVVLPLLQDPMAEAMAASDTDEDDEDYDLEDEGEDPHSESL